MSLLKHPLLPLLLILFFQSLACTHGYIEQVLPHSRRDRCYGADLDGKDSSISSGAEKKIIESLDQVGGRLESSTRVVNVESYGAKGDGEDDSEAFELAWKQACSSSKPAALLVPAAKQSYLLKPVTFSGPCQSSISVKIEGTIEASSDRSDYWDGKNYRNWILFQGIDNLEVGGGGTVYGNGQIWWANSCKVDKSQPCRDAPTGITFENCNNLMVEGLNIKDSQQIHVSFEKCNNVKASNLNINAPGTSPNTDGIHVTGTQNIQISSCVIKTGDDCISIVSGSKNVKATNIVCGPGHGISIGSLGSDNSIAQVSDVLVDTAYLTGTTNGVRIKTWQGGQGYAKNITFQNITMLNAKNPIIIDQRYCDSKGPCPEQKSAVAVSNVVYKSIRGTSASQVAINFDCSESVPCAGIVLQDINLVGEGGEVTKSTCNNVKWTMKGKVLPTPCSNGMDYEREYLSYDNLSSIM